MAIENYIEYNLLLLDSDKHIIIERESVRGEILPRRGDRVNCFVSSEFPTVYEVRDIVHYIQENRAFPIPRVIAIAMKNKESERL